MKRTYYGAAVLIFLSLACWAKPQRPVNNPRPAASPGTTTTVPARALVFSGKLVNQFSQELTVEGSGKKQTFRISERSQIPAGLQPGAAVVVTYLNTPQGFEVVRVVARPGVAP